MFLTRAVFWHRRKSTQQTLSDGTRGDPTLLRCRCVDKVRPMNPSVGTFAASLGSVPVR